MYDSDNQYSNFNNFPYDSSARKAEDPYNTVSDRNAGNVAGAPEEPKKGSGLAKKLGTAAACALVFGAVAGVTMGTVSNQRVSDRQHSRQQRGRYARCIGYR